MKRVFLVLAVLFALAPVAVHADTPLRTVVYRYSMDARGFFGAPSIQGGMVTENGGSGTTGGTGTVRVDVVKATPDDGLLVDVTQNIDRELHPLQTLRCAIYGRTEDVVCDQNIGATSTETVLLTYFGRYFYEPSRVDSSGHWHTSPVIHDKGVQIDNDFTVTKKDGDLLTMHIDRIEKGGGYVATTQGSLVYDTAYEVPDYIKVAASTQRSGEQGDMNVELKLLSDSMAPRSGQSSH
ncbi:MAG: hypothetical protein JO322_00230 [Candidatus Eremiobacteraeota bacterium]|nr:hypothetical protein [Candidatus Eremiobacteraeota bacterium]